MLKILTNKKMAHKEVGCSSKWAIFFLLNRNGSVNNMFSDKIYWLLSATPD